MPSIAGMYFKQNQERRLPMRKSAFLLLGLALFGGAISANEPDKNTKAVLDALADGQPPMMAVPQPMPEVKPEFKVPPKVADPRARGLGRVKPQKQYDYGHFKAVVGSDGKTRYFPRMMKSYDAGLRTVAYPASVDWSENAKDGLARMFMNDQLGCCVWSSRGHQVAFQTAADTGKALLATDQEIVTAYHAACGAGDNGCDMSAVNQYQQMKGWKVQGVLHKTDGSVSVDHTNKELVKAAIVVFGGINVGMSLPNDWYQSANGADWGPTSSRIVGGHEVQAYGYNDRGVLISTWGGWRTILWAQFQSTKWIDETYCTLSPDWYGSDKLAPNGINADALKSDLALVASGQIPPLPDPNPPVPVPPVPTPPTPPVPVPPVPGAGYTGSIVTIETFLNGVSTGRKVTFGAGGVSVEEDLKAAGVSPIVILDVLKLLADVRAKAARDVIIADMLKIISDLALGEKAGQIEVAPDPTGKGERHARREDAEDYYHLVP